MTSSFPLRGRRILLTRARGQNGELAAPLQALGAAVIAAPTIEIAPPDSYESMDGAIARLGGYGWLVLTSANAARVLGERLARLAATERETALAALARIQVAAVGPATAAAAEALGCAVNVRPERYVAESLAEALRERVRQQRVLIVRAQVARDVIPDALRAAGAAVDVAEAYRTVLPAGAAAELRTALTCEAVPDAVLFASSSAVRNFLIALTEAALHRPPGLHAISIGPITSATLRELGWPPAAEAATATAEGLVAACIELLAAS